MSTTMRRPAPVQMVLQMNLPVFMKEMRSRMRGMRAPVLLFITTALSIGVGLLILAPAWESLGNGYDTVSMSQRLSEVGRSLFAGLMVLEGILCALIAPAMTAGTISVEREQQTLDLLLLTRLSSLNIALGKLASSLSFIGIILLCALPVGAVCFLLGGVDPLQFIAGLAQIIATVVFFGAVGLYCSSRFQKTATSVAVSYAACVGSIGLLPLAFVLMQSMHNSTESNVLIAFFMMVLVLLCLATVPATVLSMLLTLATRRRTSRQANLIIWGSWAIVATLFLYLPGADQLFDSELLLYGNPIVAVNLILSGSLSASAYSGPLSGGSNVLGVLFVPVSILLQWLGAWIAVLLTVGELQRMRR